MPSADARSVKVMSREVVVNGWSAAEDLSSIKRRTVRLSALPSLHARRSESFAAAKRSLSGRPANTLRGKSMTGT